MRKWRPATIAEVQTIVAKELQACDAQQTAIFRRYAVEPFFASIVRDGNSELIVVVARKDDQVMYWEDVEEGFNISPISSDGCILQPDFRQDELRVALNRWINA